MDKFRPAHQVVVGRISIMTKNLQHLEAVFETGDTTMPGGKCSIPIRRLHEGRSQEIGGMCTLLDVLKEMIIPPDELERVIAELKKLTYTHVVIWDTIQSLEQRPKVPASTT